MEKKSAVSRQLSAALMAVPEDGVAWSSAGYRPELDPEGIWSGDLRGGDSSRAWEAEYRDGWDVAAELLTAVFKFGLAVVIGLFLYVEFA